MKPVVVSLLKAYKYCISPFLGARCRFYPSCSDYACEAVETHGTMKGLILAVKRIARCHPFSDGGFDPVSPTAQFSFGTSGKSCCAVPESQNNSGDKTINPAT